MRYAIVSDIHSNLPAWNAVLADLSALKARKIICLGDVVGYGPQPEAVLESAYRHIDYFVMGNHDAVVAGKMSDLAFNNLAQTMIRWTAARVPAKAKEFLAEQPLVLEGRGFVCVHGSLDRPQAFNYIVSPQEALDTWSATDAQIVFIGHSHIPGIFVLGESGTPHLIPSQDFVVEDGKRYIVNAGSVGDPRDADPRASYCLYDDATGVVTFRRVAFDYDAVRDAAAKAGLDESSIQLLRHDPISLREAVRDTLGFAPPSRDSEMAQNIVASGYIGSLRKANSRLRFGVSAAIAAFMAAAGVATALALRGGGHAASFPEKPLEMRQAIVPNDIQGNLLREFPAGPLAPSGAFAGWRYTLEEPKQQSVALSQDPDTGRTVLSITNTGRRRFSLEAADWELNRHAEGRAQILLESMREKDFQGKATITVVANRHLPDERILLSVPVSIKKPGEWAETKKIMEKKSKLRIGEDTKTLSYRLEAEFSGTLYLSGPVLHIVRD